MKEIISQLIGIISSINDEMPRSEFASDDRAIIAKWLRELQDELDNLQHS